MSKEKTKDKETKALTKVEPTETGLIELTPDTIRKYINRFATDQEIALFLNQCSMFNLNPFKREIYLIKYSKDDPANFVVGYEVYLKRADRTMNWAGMKCVTEGEVNDNSLKAIAIIRRKDWTEPLIHEVEFSEYAQYKKNGELNRFWKNKPKTMLKKVAISQGLRMTFPDEFAGMPHIVEEINDVHMERLPDAVDRYTEETEEDVEIQKKTEEREQKKKEEQGEERGLTHEQYAEITRLEATLVDKYGYSPDKLLSELEKRFGIKNFDEVTKDKAEDVIVFYKNWIDSINAKTKKKSDKGKSGELF